jgi:hypothetical protein
MVECLPHKCKTLSSKPSTAKKKNWVQYLCIYILHSIAYILHLYIHILHSVWFGAVLGFELRDLCLLSRGSTSYYFNHALAILEIILLFIQNGLDPQSSYFTPPAVAGMTGTYHHAKLFFQLRWGLSNSFFFFFNLGRLGSMIFQISVSHIALDDRCSHCI